MKTVIVTRGRLSQAAFLQLPMRAWAVVQLSHARALPRFHVRSPLTTIIRSHKFRSRFNNEERMKINRPTGSGKDRQTEWENHKDLYTIERE